MDHSILFTVLGGYLGSGKTTVLNHVLQNSESRRLAVIVNDFGSINIDASLIATRGNDMMTLANGCICCSISGGFAEALVALAGHTPPPEHVIIETSGIADPAKVAHYGHMAPYKLDGVVVVADAEAIRRRAEDKYVGATVLRQLRGADLIVLNKIDLVDETERANLRSWLQAQVPEARLFVTSQGRIPLAMLLGLHGNAPAAPPGIKHHHGEGHHHDEADDYASWSASFDSPLDEALFRAAVTAWPPTVLRAKGIVHLRQSPEQRHVFQLVGRRWSLTPDRVWGRDPHRTDIVMIGLAGQLDGAALLASLQHVQY